MDRFLYDRDLRHEKLKHPLTFFILCTYFLLIGVYPKYFNKNLATFNPLTTNVPRHIETRQLNGEHWSLVVNRLTELTYIILMDKNDNTPTVYKKP